MDPQTIRDRMVDIRKKQKALSDEHLKLQEGLLKALRKDLDIVWRITAIPLYRGVESRYLDCCFEKLSEAVSVMNIYDDDAGMSWMYNVIKVPIERISDELLARIGEKPPNFPYL